MFRVLCWLAAAVVLASAQDPRGGLVGTIEDASGARLPGARIELSSDRTGVTRSAAAGRQGQFRIASLDPAKYRVTVTAPGFEPRTTEVTIAVSSTPTLNVRLTPARQTFAVEVNMIETTKPAQNAVITRRDIEALPLAHRSFANIAYLAPMVLPVEASDPTKARITAVSFGGSSGLNVDLSVDGGDNNDDYIGGFLQNYSPDAMQEFTVRTAQFDADTPRTNGGSVVITTRRGGDQWHGSGAVFVRDQRLNARNALDNPEPEPKQPFSRNQEVVSLGGPLRRQKLWIFSALEVVRENASIAYSGATITEFQALSRLASLNFIPGVSSIGVPAFVEAPFRDAVFSTRLDWDQSNDSHWFARGSLDRNRTGNDLLRQATLPSAGARNVAHYATLLIANNYQISQLWNASLTVQGSGFSNTRERNAQLGFALAFPFSSNALATSGLETFGDNQFVTPVTAFPIERRQQKYQFRYDLERAAAAHSFKTGVNVIHEPVLGGRLASNPETLYTFPQNPSFYLNNGAQFAADLAAGASATEASNGQFDQSIRRVGVYAQDSWRLGRVTIDAGLRYDTTFGLFRASGVSQQHNPAVTTLRDLGVPFARGLPTDYRKAFAPRLGLAYAPFASGRAVLRAGAGIYYNDLAQNGWVRAFEAVNNATVGDQSFLIDPAYCTPYAIHASAGWEQLFGANWTISANYQHQQGVHQYRLYEYAGGINLPAGAPDVSVARTDNRSRYDAASWLVRRRFSKTFDLTAHYTLARANTWGATVGELFDYVNGVSNAAHAFAAGDYGPSGEDVRHRVVIAGTWLLPGHVQVATLAQFESARPFTLTTPVDVNGDGIGTNDRAVINGRQTTLDEFRGMPFQQIDLRVTREFRRGENFRVSPFVEFFNLLNRRNSGNNFAASVAQLPVPAGEQADVRHVCLDAACSALRAVQPSDLRVPAGALGDFFGAGTTVGLPFAAQAGLRITF